MEPKERILTSAESLFLRYGIRSISMDDIASNVGMSKKTLYKFYTDKDELVCAVVKKHTNTIESSCNNDSLTATNALHEIFKVMERMMEQYQNLNPSILHDLEKFHHKAFAQFIEHKKTFIFSIIVKNIERGIKEGLYRSDINIDVMSRYRLESMLIPLNVELFPPGKYNFAETSLAITEHFIYGLASEKGFQMIQAYKKEISKQ